MYDYDGWRQSRELAARIFLDNLNEVKKFPKYFQIGTVNYCNSRCIMCPQNSGVSVKKTYMKDELFEKILNELKEYSNWIESVAVYLYGEPLLDSAIVRRVAKLNNIGIKNIQLSTNAELLSSEIVEALYAAGLNDIRFSIDAFSKKTFESIRIGLDFDKVIRNIHHAIQLRNEKYPDVSIRVTFVIQERNEIEVSDFRRYWMKYLDDKKDKIVFFNKTTRYNWSLGDKERRETSVDNQACVSLFSTIVIDSDGSVPLCCLDTNHDVVFGNLNDNNTSISSIWNGEHINKLRMMHLSHGRGSCSSCMGCDVWADHLAVEED